MLKVARVPLPAFDEAARAGDLFKEEAEAAVLGMKTPEEAMASLVKRVQAAAAGLSRRCALPTADPGWSRNNCSAELLPCKSLYQRLGKPCAHLAF